MIFKKCYLKILKKDFKKMLSFIPNNFKTKDFCFSYSIYYADDDVNKSKGENNVYEKFSLFA